jgi:hypothetical protein
MDWMSFIEGAVAGFAGGITVKVIIDIRKSKTVTRQHMEVIQRDNRAGGHIAGRDINKSG